MTASTTRRKKAARQLQSDLNISYAQALDLILDFSLEERGDYTHAGLVPGRFLDRIAELQARHRKAEDRRIREALRKGE